MRLILSSCDFSNATSRQFILEHLPLPIKDCRVLFIPNEKATPGKIAKGKYHKRLQDYGFSIENIYVFDATHASDFICLDIDAIYISGGNTFLTMALLRNSGFDRAIVRYVEQGVVYIGGSAGAHLAGPSLAHVMVYDEKPPYMRDLSGLGLHNALLICHYTSERRAHYDRLMEEGNNWVIPLRDDQSVLICEKVPARGDIEGAGK